MFFFWFFVLGGGGGGVGIRMINQLHLFMEFQICESQLLTVKRTVAVEGKVYVDTRYTIIIIGHV